MSMHAEDVDACDECRKGDHGRCPDPDGCGCEYLEDTAHSGTAIQELRAKVTELENGTAFGVERKTNRKLRQQLSEVERERDQLTESRDGWKRNCKLAIGNKETAYKKLSEVELRDKAAQQIIEAARMLRDLMTRWGDQFKIEAGDLGATMAAGSMIEKFREGLDAYDAQMNRTETP